MPRILDIGCGRKKYPGSIGIDMSAAGQADVLCDWEKTLPFAESSFDQVRLIHIIEEVDNIFRVLAEVHRVAKPGARVTIITPHYTDHASLAPFQFFPVVLQRRPAGIRLLRTSEFSRTARARGIAEALARIRFSVSDQSRSLDPTILGVLFVVRDSRKDGGVGTRGG